MVRAPLLLVLSGLPGVGKTTQARRVVPLLNCVYLRVDEVEAPLIRSNIDVGGLGYEALAGIARSNLELGGNVAVDLVNPLPLTRAMWRDVAARTGAKLFTVECVLADREEHRRRVVSRSADLEGIAPPTWADVSRLGNTFRGTRNAMENASASTWQTLMWPQPVLSRPLS